MSQTHFPLLAKNLRYFRKQKERSLSYVARKAGISRVYLWELEHDDDGKKSPSAAVVCALAGFYACPIEAILFYDFQTAHNDRHDL